MKLLQRRGIAAGALAAMLPAIAATLPPAPVLVPTRDVTVDYTVQPPDRPVLDVQVAVAARGRRLHITGENLPTSFLVDRDSETAAILLPVLRTYTRVNIARYDLGRTVLRGASFVQAGRDQVAGLTCTLWRARSADGTAQACVTDDGVILSGEAYSNRKGALGAIRAQRVHYGTLPAAMFDVPPDFTESPLGQAAAQFLR